GHAMVTLANIHLLRGDEAKARKMLQDYRGLFGDIDEALRSQNVSIALSPVAGARYLLGELYQRQAAQQAGSNKDEAIKTYAKALQEYYNVFVKYGESDTGPRAGLKAKEVQQILEKDFGKTVQIDLGDLEAKAVQTQFRLADNLYRQDKYAEAVTEYLRVLNEFPETDRSVDALINLARSYVSLGDDLRAEAVTRYLAERFRSSDTAAIGVLTIGKAYVDKQRPVLARTMYEVYLANFPKHDKAGAILFYLASKSQQSGDEALAAKYLNRLISDYPDDPFYARAINQIAFSYLNAGDYAKAEESFLNVVKDTPPNPQRAMAQYNYGDSLMRQERFREAADALGTVIQWLTRDAAAYATSQADRDANQTTLQKALYQLGTSFAKISEPADAIPELRERAIKTYQQFLSAYPDADLAPRAMSGMGTVLLERKRFDEASKVFDDLAVKYPNSAEGKNALFSLARSAFEIGQVAQAVAAFDKMMRQADQYS
ncbi:MAG: tetratricopeptide repeat protein, partial [Kiritimatiellae bacterium]|nr:tetratricopeptide repeat protein [Kiritimatiellia bacterium]